MATPTLTQTERNLAYYCQRYAEFDCTVQASDLQETVSILAHLLATLLNHYLADDRDVDWRGFGADDLLDIDLALPSPRKITATGLMCCLVHGSESYLSPFVGELWWGPRGTGLTAYALCFAANGPETGPFMIRYTRDQSIRDKLLARCQESNHEWAHIYARVVAAGVE